MKKLLAFKTLTLATIAFVTGGTSIAWAVPITITTGNPNNQSTENVLFNDGSLSHSGTLVQGNFSGSGTGFIVDFTSSSGNNEIAGSGGQATITGLTGNDPFQCLTFGLEGGATFTKAIFNPDATGDGTIDFFVNYSSGSQFTQSFTLNGNGQNFFGIEAADGELISSITFCSSDTAFRDASQFRLGGFTRATSNVPDGGATSLLLGAGLTALGAGRRFLKL